MYLPTHSYIFKPLRKMWVAASVNAVVPPVQNGVDKDGKPKFIPASAWLDQTKDSQVLQMSWAPGEPEMIRDKIIDSGWILRPGFTIFDSTVRRRLCRRLDRWTFGSVTCGEFIQRKPSTLSGG